MKLAFKVTFIFYVGSLKQLDKKLYNLDSKKIV